MAPMSQRLRRLVLPILIPSLSCAFRKSYPNVMVVQPRQDCDGYNDPGPLDCPTRTMPAKDGLRLNDLCRTQQARPAPGHPDQQGTVTATQPKARRRAPQGDAELVAEEQDLGFKPARRLEEVNDDHCERMQEREQRSRSCDDSTRRCDSQAGWDFRKGHRIFGGSRSLRAALASGKAPCHKNVL